MAEHRELLPDPLPAEPLAVVADAAGVLLATRGPSLVMIKPG